MTEATPAPTTQQGQVLKALRELTADGTYAQPGEIADRSGEPRRSVCAQLYALLDKGFAEKAAIEDGEPRETPRTRTKWRATRRPTPDRASYHQDFRQAARSAVASAPSARPKIAPAERSSDPRVAIREALWELDDWATLDEIHELSGHDRGKAWTLSELRHMRRAGSVQHRFGAHPFTGLDSHLYRRVRLGRR